MLDFIVKDLGGKCLMSNHNQIKSITPVLSVELLGELSGSDLNDLCDATDAAVDGGGGFGWVELPSRDHLERFWQGAITMPSRMLFVARLDGVICGSCQIVRPRANNEAQSFAAHLMTSFMAPWARGHGLAKMLLQEAEAKALEEGYATINLDVRETMYRAISLYEKMGYKRIGEHPYYARIHDEILKGYYYYKVIDPKAFEQTS